MRKVPDDIKSLEKKIALVGDADDVSHVVYMSVIKALKKQFPDHYEGKPDIWSMINKEVDKFVKILLKKMRVEQSDVAYHHGFDLTSISDLHWMEVLKSVGITKTEPKKTPAGWKWKKGKDIEIFTKNDPITGLSYRGDRTEKNYASYIGLSGKKELVMKAVKLIKAKATDIKDESKGRRDYI